MTLEKVPLWFKEKRPNGYRWICSICEHWNSETDEVCFTCTANTRPEWSKPLK